MAYQKLQPGRGTNISSTLRSDTTDNVVLNDLIAFGASDAVGVAGELNAAGGGFISVGVRIGDVVKNNSVSGQVTTVSGVISETRLILSDSNAIYFPTDVYQIYRPPIEDAVLNVSKSIAGTSDIKITTSGGDDVTLYGLQDGTYIPIQTKRVWETIGDELVKNNDFTNGTTDWSADGSSTISVGTHAGRDNVADISITGTSTGDKITQPFTWTADKSYKVVVEVYVVSGSFRIDTSDLYVAGDFVTTSTTGSWQTLTGYITATSLGGPSDLFLRGVATTVAQFYVDSVSIRELSDPNVKITALF